MAAPIGNQFWKLRSKHGRDKLFATPELLWEAACEYFEWCDRNPWLKKEAIKSGDLAGTVMDVPTERPYTITGLCIYLGVSSIYFIDFKNGLIDDLNNDPNADTAKIKEYSRVIATIEEVIYTQKFEGAAVGAFNANIISRDLGLAEKKETEIKVPEGIHFNFHEAEGNQPIADS